jgi:hypothetical protein
MFWLAGVLQKRRRTQSAAPITGDETKPNRAFSSANLIAIIGIIVFLLSDLLQALFEDALKGV